MEFDFNNLETEENWDNIEEEASNTMTEKDINDLLLEIDEF